MLKSFTFIKPSFTYNSPSLGTLPLLQKLSRLFLRIKGVKKKIYINFMAMKKTIFLFLFLYPFFSEATIKYAKATATGSGDGTSWANASGDFQGLINGAASGDSIWVQAGTYFPSQDPYQNASPANARTKTFLLKDGVRLFGGFSGTETLFSQRNVSANVTTLSGDLGILNNNTDNAYHVVLSVNDGSSTVLDGFTIKAGISNLAATLLPVDGRQIHTYAGGGLHLSNSDLAVSHCSIVDNYGNYAGGVYTNESSPSFSMCLFESNSAFTAGGAMYSNLTTMAATDLQFINNTCSNKAATIFSHGTSGTYNRILFSNNDAGTYGGAFFCESGSNMDLINALFIDNTAGTSGGGIFSKDSDLDILFATFHANTAGTSGGAMHTEGTGTVTVKNSILWDNSSTGANEISGIPTVSNSLVKDGFAGTEIFEFDPLFTDTSSYKGADNVFGTADDGFILMTCSRAINKAGAPSTALDISNFVRPATSNDLGTYEYRTDNIDCSKLYVNVGATGTETGTSWANAFPDLQTALDYRMGNQDVDTILVASGTYYPSSSPDNTQTAARDRAFHLADSNVVIIGGYNAGTGIKTTQRSILNGDLVTPGLAVDSAYHVFITSDLSAETIIDNFEIINGKADGSYNIEYGQFVPRAQGGGMYNVVSSPTLVNLVLRNNSALQNGGGMFNDNSFHTLDNLVFENNYASFYGGGISSDGGGGTMSISGSHFIKNSASNGGGIFLFKTTQIFIKSSIFVGNSAVNEGGGINHDDTYGNPFITNCTFYENTAGAEGGGLYNWGLPSTIINTVFWKNEKAGSTDILGADIKDGSGASTVQHSLTQENSAFLSGNGIINNQAPLFVDEANIKGADGIYGTADDGLRLMTGSPVLDMGTFTGISHTEDILGARFINEPDIGAYEQPCPSLNSISVVPDFNNQTRTVARKQTISAANSINPVSNIYYQAGQSILLNPGFETIGQNLFEAKIDTACP